MVGSWPLRGKGVLDRELGDWNAVCFGKEDRQRWLIQERGEWRQ